ncbi:hypothetical protein ACQP2U_42460 (plasmid) [Nocardia sp. CA-084685]|uniref:hypothetical protein n=1 Tax=Nocardia sp. CA-084685 TaxID=3239970 RepID=UPI003D991B3C
MKWAIRSGALGAITTPRSRHAIHDDYALWCADNAVWGENGGSYPGDEKFLEWLSGLRPHAESCLFVLAPDVVGDHFATLARSRPLFSRIREMGFPVGFAAQNMMELCADPDLWEEIDCLFIAGDTAWKLGPEAANLAAVASSIGKWVHMGRVNSELRYNYARSIGCDSVDGGYITKAPNINLPTVLSWSTRAHAESAILAYDPALARDCDNAHNTRRGRPRPERRIHTPDPDQFTLFTPPPLTVVADINTHHQIETASDELEVIDDFTTECLTAAALTAVTPTITHTDPPHPTNQPTPLTTSIDTTAAVLGM